MTKAKKGGRHTSKKTGAKKRPKRRANQTGPQRKIAPKDGVAHENQPAPLATIGTMDSVADSLLLPLPARAQLDDPRRRLQELVESLPAERVKALLEEIERDEHTL